MATLHCPKITMCDNFEDAVINRRKNNSPCITGFNLETGKRRININTNYVILNYDEDGLNNTVYFKNEGYYQFMLQEQPFRVIHSKAFKNKIDFSLVTLDGYKVRKTDIPENTWFLLSGDKLTKLSCKNKNRCYLFDASFLQEPYFHIKVINKKTREENKNKYQMLVNEKLLEHNLIGSKEYLDILVPYNSDDKGIFKKLVNNPSQYDFEKLLNECPSLLEVYFKWAGYIHITIEEKRDLLNRLRKTHNEQRFITVMKRIEKEFCEYRHPVKVPYLKVIYD